MEDFKAELASLAKSRLAWFLLGATLTGTDVPSIVLALRTFVGV